MTSRVSNTGQTVHYPKGYKECVLSVYRERVSCDCSKPIEEETRTLAVTEHQMVLEQRFGRSNLGTLHVSAVKTVTTKEGI